MGVLAFRGPWGPSWRSWPWESLGGHSGGLGFGESWEKALCGMRKPEQDVDWPFAANQKPF